MEEEEEEGKKEWLCEGLFLALPLRFHNFLPRHEKKFADSRGAVAGGGIHFKLILH